MADYYIIGTKYGASKRGDMLPYMLAKQVVCIGFCPEIDFSQYYRSKDFGKLETDLKDKGITGRSASQIKRFLGLKPGDIIALKSSGSPIRHMPRLVIVAYAVVIERDGQIYSHDSEYGQLINVEFLETGIRREFSLGYGLTVHKLVDSERICQIFDMYAIGNTVSSSVSPDRNGTNKKNTNNSPLSYSVETVRKAEHNKIQQALFDLWKNQYGEKQVFMEKHFVDITVEKPNGEIILAEVKTNNSVNYCIREGLGQLLYYYHTYYTGYDNISLVVIGPNNPGKGAQQFIKKIQTLLKINFRYESIKKWKIGNNNI